MAATRSGYRLPYDTIGLCHLPRMVRSLPYINRTTVISGFGLVLILALTSIGCQRLAGKSLRDTVALESENITSRLPKSSPKTVYVDDFTLNLQDFQGDAGVRGALPGGVVDGALGRIGQGLPHPLATTDPATRARAIVQAMAEALVGELRDRGVPAERLPGGLLPHDGWLVSGRFTEVDEGNRLRRAAIGFGQGASMMEVQVGVSDLSSPAPTAPFLVFGTVKQAGEKPGATMTLNPYAAAAKFVMEKNASEKDTRKTASEIAVELLKYRDLVRGQSR